MTAVMNTIQRVEPHSGFPIKATVSDQLEHMLGYCDQMISRAERADDGYLQAKFYAQRGLVDGLKEQSDINANLSGYQAEALFMLLRDYADRLVTRHIDDGSVFYRTGLTGRDDCVAHAKPFADILRQLTKPVVNLAEVNLPQLDDMER